jgi:hypothetical protein
MNDAPPLTLYEQADLKRHEATIQRGLDTFVAVGNALLGIKRDQLWRMTHTSFEDYVEKRWRMTPNYSYKLIAAAEVVGNLCTIVQTLPATESQARPLTGLPPDQQREVWVEVVESAPNGIVTAAHVATIVEEYRSEVKPRLAVHYSSETPEHYTPPDIIEAVIACMGAIDLDPCSNSQGYPNVPATLHYTENDNGLLHPWYGRVFMNPPYGDEIAKWVDKLCSEEELHNCKEAIALVPARTDTDWFDRLVDGHRFVCYVHGRLKFVSSDGRTQSSAPFPSAIVYFGNEEANFYDAFASFGRICQEVHPEMSFAR